MDPALSLAAPTARSAARMYYSGIQSRAIFAQMQLLLRENAYLLTVRLLWVPTGIQLTDFHFPAGISNESLTRPVLSLCPILLISDPRHSVIYQLTPFVR